MVAQYIVGLILATCAAGAATASEARDGWLADFEDGTLSGAVDPHYVIRGSGGKIDDERMIFSISDGVASLGGRFDKNSTKDYVPLSWRNLNISLLDNPVLEVRFRASDLKARLLVQGEYAFEDGSRATPYFYAAFDKPDEWTTVTSRVCPDSSLPKRWTPRKLVNLNIWVMSDRPVTVDFDWVKLRGLNITEQEKEKEWIALLRDYKPREPEILHEFFPFGVYAAPPDSSSLHKMTHRMTYRNLSRHHLNFVLATSRNVEAAREMGMRVGVRMRPASNRFEEGGADAVIDFAKPIIDRFRDDPTVVCYDMGDERPIAELWTTAAAIRILNQLDPSRPSVLTFWDPAAIRAYRPYVPLDLADIYPLVESGRKPAHYFYEFHRRLARESANKRQWIILQSFGAAPWRSRRGYVVPTVEELRLQVYSALAGGARGIICYSTSYDRYRMLTDQWGNPNELMDELSGLGAMIIPIGRRLLDCAVDFDAGVSCDNEEVLIGVVKSTKRQASYVIAVNKDLNHAQSGTLSGLTAALFDLHRLTKVAEAAIEPIEPGGGRIYLLGDENQFAAESMVIRKNRTEEAERASTPDRLLAQRGCDPAVRDMLDEAARIMGQIEPAMFWDNPDSKVVELMLPFRERYWALHARWVTAYEQLLTGHDAADAATVLRYSKHVVAEVRAALGDHPLYPRQIRSED